LPDPGALRWRRALLVAKANRVRQYLISSKLGAKGRGVENRGGALKITVSRKR
jgi:hypothetical protein